MQENQAQGFLNRGIVGLLLVFSIPAILTIGAMFVVAAQGRIPGGKDSFCERAINDSTVLRLDIYAYQAGLSRFERQTIKVSHDAGETYQDLAADTVPFPNGIDCEQAIQQLSADTWLIHSEKALALSDDSGLSWQVFEVCDDPHPDFGSCDSDPLTIITIDFDESGSGYLRIRQSITDEYGFPLFQDGLPLVAQEWTVSTNDAGRTWTLETE